MKTILLFGAGKSATVLINYLLNEAGALNWKIIVADADEQLIHQKINNHPAATAAMIDIHDTATRQDLIRQSNLVISMMPPSLHILVAQDCIEFGRHLLTASYADDAIRELAKKAADKDILFLCEMGLDPGIDHMSAMQLINRLKASGAVIRSFKSHCGGLVAPESDNNPWHYKISWNPRNVVTAGKSGAIYKQDGKEVQEEYEKLFDPKRLVDTHIKETGWLSYYPNRNSLPYIELYKLQEAETFIRTTLRHSDFMYGWNNIVQLKLTDETPAYETEGLSLKGFFKLHMEKYGFNTWLTEKLTATFTQTKSLLENLMKLMEAEEEVQKEGQEVPGNVMLVDEKGDLKDIELEDIKTNAAATMALQVHEANLTLKQLSFLGMDDEETLINKGFCSAADVLQFALETKLVLKPQDRDMIVMLHEIGYEIEGVHKQVTSSLMVKGEDSLHTAMAKTVGLPLGIAAKLVLNGSITSRGLQLPVTEEIYEPVLRELAQNGISFTETA